jgi:hypothetical protein
MKSYCKNLTIDRHHVEDAYGEWVKAGAGHKNAHRVIDEYGSPDALIDEIIAEIRARTLRFRPIRRYERVEPTSGKTRLIGIQSVKQQVCDYLAVECLKPLLEARIGFYQVASMRGKGQLFAAKSIRKWVREGGYWVHLDVKKCYPSISHGVVMGLLRRYVRSPDVLYVASRLLATYGSGLDIGSYFSLRMAQLVLSQAYHHVEGLGKVRRGKRRTLITHQCWYMDDCLLMSHDKRDLKMAVHALERFMRSELGLTIKPWKICKVGDDEPVDMAGFVTRPGRTTIRASIFLRARKAFRRFARHPSLTLARRVCSYWGWITHTDSRRFIARAHLVEVQRSARALVSISERRIS